MLRLARERVEHWQVEGERLAARGAGGDDEVLAPLGRVEGVRLVAVEAVEAEACERVEDARMQPVRNGDDIGPPGRDLGAVRELFALRSSSQVTIATGAMLASSPVVPRCLTIAGSDSGGGAGHPGRPEGVRRARLPRHECDRGADGAVDDARCARCTRLRLEFIRDELEVVFDDIGVDAAKTGMLFSQRIIEIVARLPHRPPGAAGRRSRDGRCLRREASPGRRGRGARAAGCCRSPPW